VEVIACTMAHISKKKMQDTVRDAVAAQFFMSVVHARTKREAQALLSELLGDTERLMLGKRFAVIAMVVRGYSESQITELLKISPDTVARVRRNIRTGAYPRLIRYAKNNPRKFEGESFMELLEKIMQAGMPPRGSGRWKRVDRMLRDSEYFS